jgi:hypothetical protein
MLSRREHHLQCHVFNKLRTGASKWIGAVDVKHLREVVIQIFEYPTPHFTMVYSTNYHLNYVCSFFFTRLFRITAMILNHKNQSVHFDRTTPTALKPASCPPSLLQPSQVRRCLHAHELPPAARLLQVPPVHLKILYPHPVLRTLWLHNHIDTLHAAHVLQIVLVPHYIQQYAADALLEIAGPLSAWLRSVEDLGEWKKEAAHGQFHVWRLIVHQTGVGVDDVGVLLMHMDALLVW